MKDPGKDQSVAAAPGVQYAITPDLEAVMVKVRDAIAASRKVLEASKQCAAEIAAAESELVGAETAYAAAEADGITCDEADVAKFTDAARDAHDLAEKRRVEVRRLKLRLEAFQSKAREIDEDVAAARNEFNAEAKIFSAHATEAFLEDLMTVAARLADVMRRGHVLWLTTKDRGLFDCIEDIVIKNPTAFGVPILEGRFFRPELGARIDLSATIEADPIAAAIRARLRPIFDLQTALHHYQPFDSGRFVRLAALGKAAVDQAAHRDGEVAA
jgi:hypothetical protein